tara:strand:- start:125 stop:388 length:264 start_codon:yes stop_codon:yes gene_type:complete
MGPNEGDVNGAFTEALGCVLGWCAGALLKGGDDILLPMSKAIKEFIFGVKIKYFIMMMNTKRGKPCSYLRSITSLPITRTTTPGNQT